MQSFQQFSRRGSSNALLSQMRNHSFATVSEMKPFFNLNPHMPIDFNLPKWIESGNQFTRSCQKEFECSPSNLNDYLNRVRLIQDPTQTFVVRKEFALLGRSNVGKSSMINSLLNVRMMETSNVPGKTRELNFIRLTAESGAVLVDPPGYGFAKGSRKDMIAWGKMMGSYFQMSSHLHRLFVLIDSEHGMKQVDLMLIEMLESKMKPYVIVFTKCDKISPTQQLALVAETTKQLSDKPLSHHILHFTSSKTHLGVPQLKAQIAYLLQLNLLGSVNDVV